MPSPRAALSLALLLPALLLAAWSAGAQQPAPEAPPVEAAPLSSATASDPFGQEVVLPARSIIYLKGSAAWDAAFESLVDAYRSVYGYIAQQGLKSTGPAMTIYTRTDDTGFDYQAAVPIAEPPRTAPQGDLHLGQAPTGRALKFAYRGAYDAMDTAYEAVTNYLDERRIDAGDIFIEEYQTDLTRTPHDRLVVMIYVPTK
jgi:effector-binding domain-containing protein